ELTRIVDRGELQTADLDALVQHMSATAFEARAARMAAYVGATDPAENEKRLRATIEPLAKPGGAEAPLALDRLRRAVDTFHVGIVFTAHPTCALPLDLSRALARLAAGYADGRPLKAADRERLIQTARATHHRPPSTLTLGDEFAWAMEAIGHAQDALARLHAVVLDVAREIYPDDWRSLTPRLISVASWVGYDHDGRADIGWTDTLGMRLKVKLAQLSRLRAGCAALRA